MDNVDLEDKFMFKLESFIWIVGLLVLLTFSYKYNISYNFLVLIIKSALSSLMIVLMLNTNENKFDYINVIGLGYVIVNIYEYIGVIFFGENIFSVDIILVSILIESIVFIIAINYWCKKNMGSIVSRNTLFLCAVGLVCILIVGGFEIDAINIFVVINILLLIYGNLVYRNNKREDNKDEIGYIKKILTLRMLHIVCIFFISIFEEKYMILNILSDTIAILQIYLVYKITIYNSLINPYIEIYDNNKKIGQQSIVESNANIILKKINEAQEGINQKLIYKEELLRSILNSTPNGIAIFDRYGEMKEYNDAFGSIVKYKCDMKSDIYNKIVNSEKFKLNIMKVFEEKVLIEDEINISDNKIYKCTYYYMDNEDGRCICNLSDVSQEKNILNKLLDLKEEYEDLITNIKSPIFIFDEKDNIINFSKSYEEFFDDISLYKGIENKKIEINKYFRYEIYSDDLEIYKIAYEVNKKAKTNEELYNEGCIKYRVVDYSGKILWIESRAKIYNEKNKKYIMKSYMNITEYINTKNYLEKTKNIYIALLDSVPEAIYLEDLETNRYAFINEKFRNIFNVDESLGVEELGICREDLMKVHWEYDDVTKDGVSKIKENEISDYRYIKYIDMNGEIIDAYVASIPFKLHNKVFKLTIIKDMKDIEHLENLRSQILERTKIDSMKMEFFINMSHELKTPLNLIFTSTQLIENLYNKGKIGDFDSKISKHIKLTKQNSYRLLKIISDLIDFTKMESGFYKLRMENINIVELVEDISMSVVTYAKSKGIDIVFDTDVEELNMAVDINAIERILLNILSNAIKFTDCKGNIYVNIFYKENTLDIEIEDTGIGIKEDNIERIFERFNDVNKGFIGNIYGSGIGLSMVKSIANLIEAEVKVESEYGKGTKFTISLDVKEIDEIDTYNEINYDYQKSSNIERLVVDMTDIYK